MIFKNMPEYCCLCIAVFAVRRFTVYNVFKRNGLIVQKNKLVHIY